MKDKFIITRSTDELEASLETILDFIRKSAPGTNPTQSAAVRYAIITAAAEIRTQAGETK